jgi:hypothetical protein
VSGNREPRDVEARLRASLNAYADAVDVQPAQAPGRAGGSRRATRSPAWRSSLLAAAAVLAVAGGTWAVVGVGDDPSTTAASGGGEAAVLEGDARADSAPGSPGSASDASAEAVAGAAAADGALSVPSPAEVGIPYAYDLNTHCGVLGADVGGVWFAAAPPLVEESGPPAGWEDPYQRGTLTLESEDVAVFRDDAGHEVRLRAAESERPPPCD